MQLLDFTAHGHAQFRIQVGERLVKQKHLRIAHNGTPHRHTLALAARQLTGVTVQQGIQRQNFSRTAYFGLNIFFALLGQFQRKSHVFTHGHVRIQRIVLEHHRNVTCFRWQIIDAGFTDPNFTRGDLLQARNHAQQSGLAAARWADQYRERAVLNIDIYAVKNGHFTKILFNGCNRDTGHVEIS